ncbi:MAG TPA: helix-turn-helix domain-containing protein [Candidatus Mediterraneibacter intestinavium]|nr:helix-turn-helix domain-containing protein [Candidatus Mediterraneibacter intestinavium]
MANVQLVDNLRRLRDEHNYTQLQLSKKLNISRQAYSNYETGKRIPDIETLLRLTDIYGISLEDLIARPFTRMSNTAVSREDRVPYTPGLVIKSGDTIYLTDEELLLLRYYRSASSDDRRLARKVLNLPDE